jgi:hypothetical protein
MTIWTKLIAAGLLLAVLSGLALLYGNAREETGRLEERTTQQAAHAEWRKQFDRDRAAGVLRVQKAEVNLREARKQTDALKADIARRDKDAADWLAVRMPVPLSDLVWTRDAGPVGVLPGGDGIVAGFDVTGASYRPSYEQ